MLREIAFAVVLLGCVAASSIGVALVAGLGVALMIGSALVAVWSWIALGDDESVTPGDTG